MIEVITYVDFIVRIPTVNQYERQVEELLESVSKEKIKVENLLSISPPERNLTNRTIETRVYAKISLNLPETINNKNVYKYVDNIIPFLRRYLINCNRIIDIKVVQIKRNLQDPSIHEHLVKID